MAANVQDTLLANTTQSFFLKEMDSNILLALLEVTSLIISYHPNAKAGRGSITQKY